MPKFRVLARELILCETEYELEAGSPEQAVVLVQTGTFAPKQIVPLEDTQKWDTLLDVQQLRK